VCTQVGVVTNRRSWHNADLLTREVLSLYKRPLRVTNWDKALLAASRATSGLSQRQMVGQFAAVRHLPALLITGGRRACVCVCVGGVGGPCCCLHLAAPASAYKSPCHLLAHTHTHTHTRAHAPGEHDRIATPGKVAGMEMLLPRSRRAVVPACGHLSHEEAPGQLLQLLVPFCRNRIAPKAAAAAAAAAAAVPAVGALDRSGSAGSGGGGSPRQAAAAAAAAPSPTGARSPNSRLRAE
jgi:hypothetical protein